MLVKGIILSRLSQIADNNYRILPRYNVRIPVFEAQGTTAHAVFECGLCFQPGNNVGYAPGDVVLVDFENDSLNSGFIIGKLYTEESNSENKAEANPYNLTVGNSASLPENTTIGGVDVIDKLGNMQIQLDTLNNAFNHKETTDVESPFYELATLEDLNTIF